MSLPEAARMMAVWGGSAGVVGLISLALPHADTRNELALLIINLSLIVLGIAVFAAPERWPGWIVRLFPTWAVVISSSGVIFTGNPITPIAIFYLWAPIHSLMFASRREFVWTLGLTIVAATAVFATVGTPEMASTAERVRALLCGGATLAFVCAMLIYQRVRMERAYLGLEHASRTDVLTGLPNARGLHDELAQAVSWAEEHGKELSVVRVDLDHFRGVNEQVGHERGDEVLWETAELLRGAVEADDAVARSGGSEFSLVLRGRGEHEAFLVGEQVREAVRGLEAGAIGVTASVGIAAYPAHGRSAEELFKLAGRALAAAKRTDSAVIFSGEISDVLATIGGHRGQRDAALATVLGVAEAMELRRDESRRGHGARVGALAEAIARELDLSAYQAERLRLAGVLHEVGTLGIAEAIVEKPSELSAAEWKQMRMQPEIAARVLGSRALGDIRGWILALRERPDGKGYPRGLRGEEVPLAARILAVADAFDAIAHGRPYRPARGEKAALAELERGAGSQFDPEVVKALEAALTRSRSLDAVA